MNATYLLFVEWAYFAMLATFVMTGQSDRKDAIAVFGMICCVLGALSIT